MSVLHYNSNFTSHLLLCSVIRAAHASSNHPLSNKVKKGSCWGQGVNSTAWAVSGSGVADLQICYAEMIRSAFLWPSELRTLRCSRESIKGALNLDNALTMARPKSARVRPLGWEIASVEYCLVVQLQPMRESSFFFFCIVYIVTLGLKLKALKVSQFKLYSWCMQMSFLNAKEAQLWNQLLDTWNESKLKLNDGGIGHTERTPVPCDPFIAFWLSMTGNPFYRRQKVNKHVFCDKTGRLWDVTWRMWGRWGEEGRGGGVATLK